MWRVVALSLIALGLGTIWAAQRWLFLASTGSWPITELGPWGDTFGALNTLFAALGFIVVVFTFIRQQDQIKAAQEEQHRQRFESSFFTLLNMLKDLKTKLRFRHGAEYMIDNPDDKFVIKGGSSALQYAWREAIHWLDKGGTSVTKEVAANIYDKCIHRRYENSFGPYYRVLYTICFRIKTDGTLTDEEKIRYGNLLRSQLSSYEIAVLGLNGLSKVSKDLADYIIYFRLLKYLPEGERRDTLARYYPREAFLGREVKP
jgi:hypothetical protein